MKTLKRTVIIRDVDLDNLLKKAVKLYHRIDIQPMTYKEIQHENLMAKLKNPHDETIPRHRTLPDVYEDMLYREQIMYDRRYMNWHFTMDYPAGQIYVQSKMDQPKQPLFRVVFEKDYESTGR